MEVESTPPESAAEPSPSPVATKQEDDANLIDPVVSSSKDDAAEDLAVKREDDLGTPVEAEPRRPIVLLLDAEFNERGEAKNDQPRCLKDLLSVSGDSSAVYSWKTFYCDRCKSWVKYPAAESEDDAVRAHKTPPLCPRRMVFELESRTHGKHRPLRESLLVSSERVEEVNALKEEQRRREEEEAEAYAKQQREWEARQALSSAVSTSSRTPPLPRPKLIPRLRRPEPTGPKYDKATDQARIAFFRDDVPNRKYDPEKLGWCRYCGAEETSGWARGPWGPNYLCQTCYIAWHKKRTLSFPGTLSVVLPSEPINRSVNSEYDHLMRKKEREAKQQWEWAEIQAFRETMEEQQQQQEGEDGFQDSTSLLGAIGRRNRRLTPAGEIAKRIQDEEDAKRAQRLSTKIERMQQRAAGKSSPKRKYRKRNWEEEEAGESSSSSSSSDGSSSSEDSSSSSSNAERRDSTGSNPTKSRSRTRRAPTGRPRGRPSKAALAARAAASDDPFEGGGTKKRVKVVVRTQSSSEDEDDDDTTSSDSD